MSFCSARMLFFHRRSVSIDHSSYWPMTMLNNTATHYCVHGNINIHILLVSRTKRSTFCSNAKCAGKHKKFKEISASLRFILFRCEMSCKCHKADKSLSKLFLEPSQSVERGKEKSKVRRGSQPCARNRKTPGFHQSDHVMLMIGHAPFYLPAVCMCALRDRFIYFFPFLSLVPSQLVYGVRCDAL